MCFFAWLLYECDTSSHPKCSHTAKYMPSVHLFMVVGVSPRALSCQRPPQGDKESHSSPEGMSLCGQPGRPSFPPHRGLVAQHGLRWHRGGALTQLGAELHQQGPCWENPAFGAACAAAPSKAHAAGETGHRVPTLAAGLQLQPGEGLCVRLSRE